MVTDIRNHTSKLHHNQAMILENPQPKHVSHQSKEFEHIYQHRNFKMQNSITIVGQHEMLNIQL